MESRISGSVVTWTRREEAEACVKSVAGVDETDADFSCTSEERNGEGIDDDEEELADVVVVGICSTAFSPTFLEILLALARCNSVSAPIIATNAEENSDRCESILRLIISICCCNCFTTPSFCPSCFFFLAILFFIISDRSLVAVVEERGVDEAEAFLANCFCRRAM